MIIKLIYNISYRNLIELQWWQCMWYSTSLPVCLFCGFSSIKQQLMTIIVALSIDA
jgi:hypothetical protein